MNRLLLVTILILVMAATAWANADSHSRSISDVEAEIRGVLNLETNEEIDPENVPDELLISLGDAVMGSYIGDERRHEWMDQMMGGEGSESLDSYHRWMAYRYLSGGYSESGGYGMVDGGMMGSRMMGSWGLMGNPDKMFDALPSSSPEEILKRRYANGEITREEYNQILSDLN